MAGAVTKDSMQSAFGPGERVSVLLPLPLPGAYDYRIPAAITVTPGQFVEVPFVGRQTTGVVWGGGSSDLPEQRLREVTVCLDAPPLPLVSLRFVSWVASYTVHPEGSVLRMTMSVPEALRPRRAVPTYGLATPLPPIRWTAARKRVHDVAAAGPPRSAADLARAAQTGAAVVAGLVGSGALVAVEPTVAASGPATGSDPERPAPSLSPRQQEAADRLRAAVGAGFSVSLIDGVAGSGKTEVYFEAIAETLRRGQQVLVLLPEIALGAQWLARFHARFGSEPGQWHSDLARSYKRRIWRDTAEGRARVVVGARSALFLPFPDLGLIIVDEEHDPAFKQEDGVAYNARDMAVVRARLGAIPIVLVSATPSLESVVNVDRGRYAQLHLPERHGGAAKPDVVRIDMRADRTRTGSWLSPSLIRAMERTLEDRCQSLLFLNRRGYAPLTICRACGFRIECLNCTAWLVEHRLSGRLQCHHCGFSSRIPDRCPSCAQQQTLVGCGPGVERVAEEVGTLFPQARCVVATSDTLTGPVAATELVRAIEEHEVDIVVGTQILAKGYHFPLLTLVGVVDADLGLSGGDLRAAERTYQLLSQVAGRAGRAELPGQVMIQTYMPDHPVIAAVAGGDRDRFLAVELAARREAGMPPFGRLAAIIVSGSDEAAVKRTSRDLARAAPEAADLRVLGPAPAPLALLRGRHRQRLLVKASRGVDVPSYVRRWLVDIERSRSTRIQVDIDPYSFL